MKEEALSWTLTIMHTFSELSDPFCIHRSNYKERKKKKKTEEQFTEKMAEGKRKNKQWQFFLPRAADCCCLATGNKCSYISLLRGCLGARFWSSKYILTAVQENTSSRSKIANPRELAEAVVFAFYHPCGSLSKGSHVGGHKQVCVTAWFSGLLLHSQSVWECCLFKNKL